jgi:hypothetical protein
MPKIFVLYFLLLSVFGYARAEEVSENLRRYSVGLSFKWQNDTYSYKGSTTNSDFTEQHLTFSSNWAKNFGSYDIGGDVSLDISKNNMGKDNSSGYREYSIGPFAHYFFKENKSGNDVIPYVGAFLGIGSQDYSSGGTDSSIVYYGADAGVLSFIKDYLAINTSLRYRIVDRNYDNFSRLLTEESLAVGLKIYY